MREPRLMDHVSGLVQITRPHIGLQAAFYALLGVYLSEGGTYLLSSRVLVAAFVVALIVAFGYVVNDYCDIAVDSLYKPDRSIPSGRVSRRAASVLALILALIALGAAQTLSLWLATVALMTIIVSASYSFFLKNILLLGNITMASLNATIVVFGSWVASGPTPIIWMVSLLVFLYTCAQEVLFAVADQRGDARAGLRTTAVRLGTTNALFLFRAFALAFTVAAVSPWFLRLASVQYLCAILLCSVFPVMGNVVMLSLWTTDGNIRRACRLTRLTRISSLFAVILLK